MASCAALIRGATTLNPGAAGIVERNAFWSTTLEAQLAAGPGHIAITAAVATTAVAAAAVATQKE